MDNRHLKHYASPYYDPVKAHEYYMRTRELKGRQSTAGLNEEGRTAAKYVKEQLTSERKQKTNDLRSKNKSTIESHRNEMQAKINSLNTQLKGMGKEEKMYHRVRFKKEIAAMREQNKAERRRLSEEFKKTSGALKTEYDEKYYSELEKIRADPAFRRTSKR